MRRSRAAGILMVVVILVSAVAHAGITRDEVLEKGLRNNEAYSYILEAKAGKADSSEQRRQLLQEAITISPDIPGLYFKMAWAQLPNLANSIDYAVKGFKAYSRSFWWAMSLTGLIYVSLAIALFLAFALVVLMRLPMDLPLMAHDMNENKAKLLLPLMIVVPLSVFGLVAFLVGCFFLAGFYMKKGSKPAFYFVAVLLVLSPLLVRVANTYLSAPSPELRAIVAVNEGRDNRYAIETLGDSNGFAPRFSYATALKREGRAQEAVEILSELVKDQPRATAYTNLGNAYVAAGLSDYAKTSYGKALELNKSAVTLYNLSQVYRDEFDYKTGDKFYDEATGVDRPLVLSFTAVAGKTPNRLVVDESLPGWELWKLADGSRRAMVRIFPVSSYAASFVMVILIIIFSMADKGMTNRAFRCSRCGKISCAKCSGGKSIRGKICLACYRAQMNPDEETPKARVARMLAVSEQKNRQMNTVRVLSFAPPGIAQVYSGRVFSGMIYLWLFMFAIITLVLNPFFTTGMSTYSHNWLAFPAVLLAIVLYVFSFVSTNRRLDRGWL